MRPQELDVVCMWVDDRWPGYARTLSEFADDPEDANPNRTRDNLDLLRFGLRSLEQNLPWLRTLWLYSARPQVPAWLDVDHPQVRIVHHDVCLPQDRLPTFNSFAILSAIHRIPGLAEHFLLMEDDRMLGRPVRPEDLWDAEGRKRLWLLPGAGRPAALDGFDGESHWDAALSHANALLNQRYGARRRGSVKHAPLLADRTTWQQWYDAFPDAIEATQRGRFRGYGQIAPEHMYPWFLMEEGHARPISKGAALLETGFWPLGNRPAWNRFGLSWLDLQRPRFVCLNDDFDVVTPNAKAEDVVRRWLHRRWPTPSRFERPAPTTGPERP